MRTVVSSLLLAILLLSAAAQDATCQEWTRFRGPNGSGVSPATTVPTQWTEADYNWRVKLPGVGHSSPVLWDKSIFLTSGDEKSGQRVVQCLDAADGSQKWMRRYDAEVHRKHKLNSFATATPAVDAQHVYVTWATPKESIVLALDHQGKEIWRTDLGPYKAGYGLGVSPIIHQDMLVLANDRGADSFLLALDCATGKTRWKLARKGKTSYSTPCVYHGPGRSAELIFTNWDHGITAVDPLSGKVNWEIDAFDKSHIETAIGSPIVSGDLVLGICGYLGHGTEVVAVRPDSTKRQTSAQQVYRIDRGAPLCTTSLVVGDLLFLWADEGIVTCADVATGKIHWRKRAGGTYYASPVAVGGHVYNISAAGDVVVLAASKKFQQVARIALGEPSHSTPSVAGGVMYLRTFSELYSLGGKR